MALPQSITIKLFPTEAVARQVAQALTKAHGAVYTVAKQQHSWLVKDPVGPVTVVVKPEPVQPTAPKLPPSTLAPKDCALLSFKFMSEGPQYIIGWNPAEPVKQLWVNKKDCVAWSVKEGVANVLMTKKAIAARKLMAYAKAPA